jgi:predicted RNase H-like HicB family nuclease
LELKDRGPIPYQVASLRPEGKGEAELMLREYINAAMQRAHYELINQPDQSYYGEIPGLDGVLATGKTLEECRANLEDALDAWLALGLQLGHAIPEVGGVRLERLRVQR